MSGHTASYYNQKRVLMIMFLIQVVEFPFPSRPSYINSSDVRLIIPKSQTHGRSQFGEAWFVAVRGAERFCTSGSVVLFHTVSLLMKKKNSPSRNVLALTGLSEAIGKQRVETTPELRVGDEL